MENAHTVQLDGADGPLPLYETWPAKARAAVVVVQEAFGVNNHIEDVAKRLAAQGYYAVAPQLFHRAGVNEVSYDDMPAAKAQLAELSEKGIRIDIETTLERLAAQGFPLANTGIVGFCMGGSVVVPAACDHAFGAAVTFYGGGVVEGRFGYSPLAELAPDLKAPWLGLFGDKDQSIPFGQVELLRDEAAKATVPTSIVRYSDAGHGFHCDARPTAYHEASAKDAWAKTLDWFTRFIAEVGRRSAR
ncbi:MAG: dienelactone hydrolase family protein [Acidothermaceae bacterium]